MIWRYYRGAAFIAPHDDRPNRELVTVYPPETPETHPLCLRPKPATVNWTACGATELDEAERFAKALLFAVQLGRGMRATKEDDR